MTVGSPRWERRLFLSGWWARILWLAVLPPMLVGCGGSSSQPDPSTSTAPRFQISSSDAPYRREDELRPGKNGLFGPEPEPIIPDAPPPKTIALQDLVEGIGKFPSASDKLRIQYVGYDYVTRKKFGSSWDEGAPRVVTLGNHELIEGLEEGLQELETADRREIVIPPNFSRGGWPAGKIAPGATSVFVVDLLAVE
jgi:FKBP-type peptidyl-prolyl cis-trans isomerase